MRVKRNGPRAEQFPVPASRKLRILFLRDPDKPRAEEIAAELRRDFGARSQILGEDVARIQGVITVKPDLVVVLGGDGSMIAACARMGRRQVPIMGVNLGTVGFLAAVAPERANEVLDMVLEGKARLEEHAMMQTQIRRQSKVFVDTHVLNEVVVDSASSSMVDIDLRVDRRPVTTYRGDGLIVATATGSTAYSLSAGGPILSPKLDAFVITPLAPHMLTSRPLVLPGQRVTSLRVMNRARFVADGHEIHNLEPGDEVRIGPSPRRFTMVVDPDANFYARLRSKLLWGRPPGPG